MYEIISEYYEAISISRWFAISAPLMALTIFWQFPKWNICRSKMTSFFLGAGHCIFCSAADQELGRGHINHSLKLISLYSALVLVTEWKYLNPVKHKFYPYIHAGWASVKKPLEQYPVICTSILITLFLLPPLFHVFDVTDAGYHLSQGMMVFNYGLSHIGEYNVSFFSYYFAGAVIALLNYFDIGMVGTRLVWVAIVIAPIAIVMHIFAAFFFRHWLLPFFGLAAAANLTNYTRTLDYENVPAFFAAILVYCSYLVYRKSGVKSNPLVSVAVGLSFVFLVLSRISSLTSGILFAIPLAALWLQPSYRTLLIKNMGIQAASVVAFFCVFLVMLYSSGTLSDYFTFQPRTDLHSFSKSIAILTGQVKDFFALQTSIVTLLLGLILALAIHIKDRYLFLSVVTAIILLASYYVYGNNPFLPYTLPVALCSLLVIFGAILCWPSITSEKRLFFTLLIGMAFVLPWAPTLGSYSGLTKLVNGMFLTVPLSLMLLLVASRNSNSPNLQKNLLGLAVILSLVLIVSGYRTFHRYPYGDHYTRLPMTGMFTHPKLAGIHTMPGRRDSFQGLLEAIDKHKNSASNIILAYNNIPMLFYATNTYPLLREVWIPAGSIAINKDIADRLCTTPDTTPGLIVRTKVETRSGNWGNNKDGPPIVEDILLARSRLDMFDAAIAKCRSKLLWENMDFQLLAPEKAFIK